MWLSPSCGAGLGLAVLLCFQTVARAVIPTIGHDMQGAACLPHMPAAATMLFIEAGRELPAGCRVMAHAGYIDGSHTASNFGKLRIIADDQSVPALLRYRAAGYLEGYLTAVRIWHHFQNMKSYFENQLYPGVDIWGPPMQWISQQDTWLRNEIKAAYLTPGSILNRQHHWLPQTQQVDKQQSEQQQGSQQQSSRPELDVLSAVELLLAQFDGLIEGYAARVAAEEKKQEETGKPGVHLGRLTRTQHQFMQNNGELYDIVDGWLAGSWGNATLHHATRGMPKPTKALHNRGLTAAKTGRRSFKQPSRSADSWMRLVTIAERCSALVKVTSGLEDLLIGHATWDTFTNMLHIYKHYEFGSPGFGRQSFSSYPGETFSDDDFYLLESGLVILETTNHIFDPDVYTALKPQTLLSWQRVRAANLLASNGEEWVRTFATANSGTYNNQYMVLDLNKFKPKAELQRGLFWVVEQLPGIVQALDMTDVLARGYWGSYNVPFFDEIYNKSGYPDMTEAIRKDQQLIEDPQLREKYNLPIRWLHYQISPRASIFRRDQAAAESLEEFKELMRYNNYKHDEYADGAPMAAVCGRSDLPYVKAPRSARVGRQKTASTVRRSMLGTLLSANSHDQQMVEDIRLPLEPRGCYDGKVTSYKLAKALRAQVVNGPTQSHELPMYSWSAFADQYSHVGHPDTFNFTWEEMSADDIPLVKLS